MYTEFYKLKKQPFQLTPDIEMLYVSEGHKNALSYFHYGIVQGEGFVVLTGNAGTGKTTLIKSLLNEIKGQEIIAASITAGNLDAYGVLETICLSLGLSFENKSKVSLIKGIKDYLLAQHNKHNRVLLIVDEAQTLIPEALEQLRILSNLEQNGKSLMQIFLVGQEELNATLLSSEFEHLRQRIIASYHLASLNQADTQRYIEHRLSKSGWQNDPKISNDVYPHIYTWSAGIPRKINLICDRLFLHAFTGEKHTLGRKDIEQVVEDTNRELSGHIDAVVPKEALEEKYNQERSYNDISLTSLNYKTIQKLVDSIAGIETALKQFIEIYSGNNKKNK